MITFRIWKAVSSNVHSLQIDEFHPIGGFEVFAKGLADYLGEMDLVNFLDT